MGHFSNFKANLGSNRGFSVIFKDDLGSDRGISVNLGSNWGNSVRYVFGRFSHLGSFSVHIRWVHIRYFLVSLLNPKRTEFGAKKEP